MKRRRLLSILVLVETALAAPAADTVPRGALRFGRDVLPVLSENCFACHGPDEKARKGKLRLDDRAGALKVLAPGKSAESELVRRINATPDDGHMPPAKANRTLTDAQKQVLKRWVDEGAVWGKHWAYEAPVRPDLPPVRVAGWPRNAVDRFVLARLEREGLPPSPEAPRATLLRRVTLDLTGLPPTPAEVDAFLADRRPDAYEKVVDRLLASPRYGERMALDWLDAARYADTNGYQNDFARTMWPWRDEVIAAFNSNQPFDLFATEQIAGDLLPGATRAQPIASGFNRNNRTVTEAGSIDEEWRVENAVDRVETTATTFLGLTLGCARCHDHKFDPVSQREFYQFFGFFNSVNERGVYTEQPGNVPPLIPVPDPEQEARLRKLAAAAADAEKAVRAEEAETPRRQERWEQGRRSAPVPARPAGQVLRCPLDGGLAFSGPDGKKSGAAFGGKAGPAWADGPSGKALRLDGGEKSFVDFGAVEGLGREGRFSLGLWLRPGGDGAVLGKCDPAGSRGFVLFLSGGKVVVELVNERPGDALRVATREALPKDVWSHVLVCYDGSGKAGGVAVYVGGRRAAADVQADGLRGMALTDQPLRLGRRAGGAAAFRGDVADVIVYGRMLAAAEADVIALRAVEQAVQTPQGKRSAEQRNLIDRVFRGRYAVELIAARDKAARANKEKADYEKRIPTVMVMEDLKIPRETYLLKRGRYDTPDKTQKLEPGVPGCLPPLPDGAPRNRLGLARWLVSPNNPLTARVTVNRYWQHYFGTGLVKTAENFGIQGELPSHPELLDWLATEFVRTGWDVKAMQRLIVTTATYRQSSAAGPSLVQRDPENRLLARGPRFRLPAEMVRDNALAAAGLLVEKIGGPPVKPYQPAGLWEELAGGAGEGPYVQDKGPGLYRRSLYVYRKRTVPHPVLATWDAPGREVCQVRRVRTNTPLQALELLNDVTYAEAARRLAERTLAEGGRTPAERVGYAFRLATARAPAPDELRVLLRGLERYRRTYAADRESARRFVRQGESVPEAKLDPGELAAYTATSGVILNLDEAVTKE